MAGLTVSGTVTDRSGNTAAWSATASVQDPVQAIPGLPPTGQMYYGTSIEGADSNLTTFENTNMSGAGMQLFRKYFQSNDSAASIVNTINSNQGPGRIVLASVKFPVSWQSVAAGGDDARMTALAQGLNNLSRPTWLAFHHEPNGDVNSTNQRYQDFRAMYARLTPIFRQYAPTKVAIIVILNGEPLISKPADRALWPADSDYDLPGFDRYNAWSATNGKQWRWPADTLGELMDALPATKSRWVIGEFGCREDPTNTQRAADWLQQHYDYSVAHGAAATCYFNSGANSPDGPWTLSGARLTKWNQLRGGSATYRMA